MTNTSTNAGTTLKRTVALAAAASLAVMGTIAEEAHAAPVGNPGLMPKRLPPNTPRSTGRTGQTRHGVHRSVRAFSRPPQRPFWTQH
ncbi:rare lipoprotein A [Cutibacterium acnes JCM 18909]|nr:rare lipoprotein A [Cutibacterium acnes JCM 18909]